VTGLCGCWCVGLRGVVARTHTRTHTYTTSSLILTVWQAILISPAMACWIYPCTDMKRYFGVWKVVWRRNDVVTICVLLLRCIDDVMSPALYANLLPRSSAISLRQPPSAQLYDRPHSPTFLPLPLHSVPRRKSTNKTDCYFLLVYERPRAAYGHLKLGWRRARRRAQQRRLPPEYSAAMPIY
jgi:hypothetical protein